MFDWYKKFRMNETMFLIYLSLKVDHKHWKVRSSSLHNSMNSIHISTLATGKMYTLSVNGESLLEDMTNYEKKVIQNVVKRVLKMDKTKNRPSIKVSTLNPEDFI